jgi:RNA polymerase sigma factor (sigma-70 family)
MKTDAPTPYTPKETLTDVELIARILAGHKEYFELFIRRYNGTLYKLGRSYGFAHTTVQDLMQDTYVAAYQALGQFEGRASFETWLIRIMLNHCYQWSRKAAHQPQPVAPLPSMNDVPESPHDPASDGQREILNRELGAVLEHCIQALPPDYRLVFVLRELEGLSSKETAQAVDITETNVNVRLNRAKSLLRRQLENWYPRAEVFEFNRIYCDAMVARVFRHI